MLSHLNLNEVKKCLMYFAMGNLFVNIFVLMRSYSMQLRNQG